MTDTDVTTSDQDALVDRLFQATIGTLELFSVHLGWRLGLYTALGDGPCTPAELAERAGIDQRYAREWLEQQAAAGFVEADGSNGSGESRRYSLPPAHAEVFADPESLAHVAPFAPMVVGIAGAIPAVVDAYRTGDGVPYRMYGVDFREGQGAINRPAYVHELSDWFASVPDLHARLQADPPARVADLGCGQGFSTIALARAYPQADVTGFDLDGPSIADATREAEAAGVSVRFEERDAAGLADAGPFDLVCIFEALHDMARPDDVLASIRQALAPDGQALVMDERVADEFTAPGDEVERMMYGWSIVHCLPASREEQPSAALGTVLRAGTVRELASGSGFSDVEVLGIENDFFRFYRLRP